MVTVYNFGKGLRFFLIFARTQKHSLTMVCQLLHILGLWRLKDFSGFFYLPVKFKFFFNDVYSQIIEHSSMMLPELGLYSCKLQSTLKT